MKAKRVILVILTALVFIQVFLIDVVQKSLGPGRLGLFTVKQILLIAGIALFYLLINKSEAQKERIAVSKIGALLLLVAGIMVVSGITSLIPSIEFDLSEDVVLAKNYFTVIISNIYTVLILYI